MQKQTHSFYRQSTVKFVIFVPLLKNINRALPYNIIKQKEFIILKVN